MAIEISSPSSDVVAARILVVDDNPGTAETLARAVSRISPNLQVIAADGAKTALKQLDGEAVDLVITDMMMPDMNGLELIERLRKQSQGNQLYSILITAYEVPGLRESARRMKVNDVLIKPFPPEKICEIVRRALERTQPVPALTAPSAALEPSRPTAHLLVADDNPSNISLLMRYLQTESYRITTASNGTETLEKLRAEPPDLLLLDVNMPEMDGFQVLEKMRADPALQHIPVIIVTAARLDPVDMQYALNMGAEDYITKPFDRRELMARIRTRLRVKQAEDILRRRSQYLDFLLETERMLAQPGSEEDSLASLLRRLSETLQAQCGYLWTKINDKIVFRAFLANQTAPVSAPPPQVFSILEKFQQQPEGWFVEDVRKATDCIFPPNDSVRSMAAVPLINQSGLLLVLSEQPGCFDQQAFSLLQSVAYMVSLVITCEKSDLL